MKKMASSETDDVFRVNAYEIICRYITLELAPFHVEWLPQSHRASPSTALDDNVLLREAYSILCMPSRGNNISIVFLQRVAYNICLQENLVS